MRLVILHRVAQIVLVEERRDRRGTALDANHPMASVEHADHIEGFAAQRKHDALLRLGRGEFRQQVHLHETNREEENEQSTS